MQSGERNYDILDSTVAVVGLGKIGLPLAVQYAQHGWRVIGCDINPEVVERVNASQSHIQEEPGLAAGVADAIHKGLLSATLNTTEAVLQADVVVVIVPVVIDTQHNVNFTSIDTATAAIGSGLRPGTLVIYETTLPVGTTAGRLSQTLKRTSHLKAGQDFFLAYSPERVMSGSIFRDLRTYPKIVGGIDDQSTAIAVAFYQSVLEAEIIPVASTDKAEFIKLIGTTYRDVNIALANEFARYADAFGLDVAEAISAANSYPYTHIHTPGVGVGGHCIPVYPYFLLAGLEGTNHTNHTGRNLQPQMLTLPRSARRINDAMAEYAVHRVEAIIGLLAHQPVLILGVAYRGNVHEAAFSSTELLQKALLGRGATVYVDDPLFSEEELQVLGYTLLPTALESKIRVIILQADHHEYQQLDFSRYISCQVVLDGRNALNREKIESLGKCYIAIGDGQREELKMQEDEQLVTSLEIHNGRYS